MAQLPRTSTPLFGECGARALASTPRPCCETAELSHVDGRQACANYRNSPKFDWCERQLELPNQICYGLMALVHLAFLLLMGCFAITITCNNLRTRPDADNQTV